MASRNAVIGASVGALFIVLLLFLLYRVMRKRRHSAARRGAIAAPPPSTGAKRGGVPAFDRLGGSGASSESPFEQLADEAGGRVAQEI